jgi:hypothetical protein
LLGEQIKRLTLAGACGLRFWQVGKVDRFIRGNETASLLALLVVVVVAAGALIVQFFGTPSGLTWAGWSITAIASVAFAVVACLLLARAERRERRRRVHERQLLSRTAELIGRHVGVQPELVSTITSVPAYMARNPHPTTEEAAIDEEAATRAETAITELQRIEQARADAIEERMRAIEEKLPDAEKAERYAHSNELYLLAFELGELSKRIDRIEDKQITRTQVAGIVITTLLAAIAVTAALFMILKALGVLH